MIKNKEEIAAQKEMEKFQKQYLKLLAKFPKATLYGDVNGNIVANMYSGEGMDLRTVRRQFPSFFVVEAK